MVGTADYGVALGTARNFCKAAGDIEAWDYAVEALRKDMSAKAVQLVFVCARNKRVILNIEAGDTQIPLMQWIGLNEASLRDVVSLAQTNESYKTIQFSFTNFDREWELVKPRSALGPDDIDHAFVASSGFPGTNIVVLLSVLRDEEQGPFTSRDVEQLELCREILYNAFSSYAQHHVQNSTTQSLIGMVNRAHFGFMVVDAMGHLLVCNEKAQALIDQKDLFELSNGKTIAMKNSKLHEQFKDYLSAVIKGCEGAPKGVLPNELIIRIDPRLHLKGYLFVVSPLQIEGYLPEAVENRHRTLAHVQIIDLNEKWNLQPETLMHSLDITMTEAEVLKYLSEGMSPKDIAAKKQRSYHTIRNHLQKIMNKTGMHKQADLILLVYSIVLSGAATSEQELQSQQV